MKVTNLDALITYEVECHVTSNTIAFDLGGAGRVVYTLSDDKVRHLAPDCSDARELPVDLEDLHAHVLLDDCDEIVPDGVECDYIFALVLIALSKRAR